MNVDYDEATGQVAAQFPDIYCALYPAGHRTTEDGKDDFYRGALTISHGKERVHLNALDIGDLLVFLADARVIEVRKIMTKEHVATNLLRSLLLESTVVVDSDE